MPRTRVKICGICRAEDAAAAVRAGADAIGMVFDPQAGRCVREADAPKILEAVPAFVAAVGVFANHSMGEIRSVVNELPFSTVQLNGDESPEFVDDLKPIRVIKALRVSRGDTGLLEQWRSAAAELELTNLVGIVLETAGEGKARGGTGVANDFGGLAEMRKAGNFDGLPPLIAAGGLTAENVGEAIHLLHPMAVDVSSGVESAPRQKSAEKIEAFIRAVRAADGG